jgi:hypothetical protein
VSYLTFLRNKLLVAVIFNPRFVALEDLQGVHLAPPHDYFGPLQGVSGMKQGSRFGSWHICFEVCHSTLLLFHRLDGDDRVAL